LELSAEIERWLADEPVTAHRDALLDRARRWGRKHRTLVSSGVAMLLVALVGLSVGLGAVKAEERRTAKQLDRAIAAEAKATANLEKAEANLRLAKNAVNDTFDVAKSNRLLQQDSTRAVRKLLLEKALPFYRRFRELRGDDAQSRAELAEHLYRVGLITSEIG